MYRITSHITTCVAATEKIRYVVITLLERRVLVTSFFIRILDVRKSWWFQLLRHVSMAAGKDFISNPNLETRCSSWLTVECWYHYRQTATVTVVRIYITILYYRVSLQPLSLWWHLQSYTTVTSLTMTPGVYLKVGTPSYRATCWYKNLSYSDMSLFYQKQYLSFLMISISATCRNMRGYTVIAISRKFFSLGHRDMS